MNTKELLKNLEYEIVSGDLTREVGGISFDNRNVRAGDVFCCIKGVYFDTHEVISEVAKADPALIIVSRDWYELEERDLSSLGAPVVICNDTRHAKAAISASYYGFPAEKMTMIGVTGSKGKTTTTHMLKTVLESAGRKVGMIGTTGGYISGERRHFGTTTPDSDKLHEYLAEMAESGCDTCVLEVSSQAVKMRRVDAITFDYGLFLNIEEGDHISPTEHKDFAEYLDCKKELLRNSRTGIVNRDDQRFDQITDGIDTGIVTFGHDERSDYRIAGEEEFAKDGLPHVSFELLDSSGESRKIDVGMPGLFNVMNAAAACVTAEEMGINQNAFGEALSDIKVPGRLEIVYRSDDLSVCVDYAHNGQSTRKLLEALRAYAPKRIVLVFGCGGDRDRDRRPEMGEAAGKGADLSIITTEHNRSEAFEDILKGIKEGIDKTDGKYVVIEDRKEAIRKAVMESEPGDLVAVIGIGNDGFQHDHGKDIPHDDIAFSKQMVEEWKKGKNRHMDYFASPEQFDVTEGMEHYENTEGAVLIDVRHKAEYREGHIPGAICVPLQKIEERIEKTVPDKDTPVFLYCVTGARSGRASAIMRSMGYEHVYNIGGILGYDGELEK